MTWVKICGTTSLHDAQISIAAGANALGFIFAPSVRQVGVAEATEIIAALPNETEKIGVFVDESPARVSEIAAQAGLTGIQLHGDEPPEQLLQLRQALGRRKIIKALPAKALDDSAEEGMAAYLAARVSVDAILLDSGSPDQHGGTGVPFAWEAAVTLVRWIQRSKPLIVAGGLNAENVGQAIQLFSPWGVDVVSGVESEPGRKDAVKLHAFVAAVRRAQEAR